MSEAALSIEGLSIEIRHRNSVLRPVREVSLKVGRGQRVGIVGESGSGKSLTALACMRLLKSPVRISSGRIVLGDETDIVGLTEAELCHVRGNRIAMIYQDPLSALNPIRTVGEQILEAVRTHERLSTRVGRRRVVELLGEVGIPQPAERAGHYPHEFSGGMRQRVVIAMALSASPEVIVADEPTTALDVTTQAVILELLARLTEDHGVAVIFITHDLAVAGQFCDEVRVMYAGRFVESGSVEELYVKPFHPYTEALLASVCDLQSNPLHSLPALPGQPPALDEIPSGCAFHPRCPYVHERCVVELPVLRERAGRRLAACHLADGIPLREGQVPRA
jgi:peptide/nickel transport system ATP-binding protein